MKMKQVVIVDSATMLQRFFFSCFTITNDHKDYVKASLIKNIACMFHVTVEQLKEMTNWKMVSIGKKIDEIVVILSILWY